MQAVTTIGLDIAKSVFQVQGVDAEGRVLIRRKLKRRYVLAYWALYGARACMSVCGPSRARRTKSSATGVRPAVPRT